MNGSERPGGTSPEVVRFSAYEFRQYLKEHPLWQDINFTPEWLHKRVSEGPDLYYPPHYLSESAALQPHQQREVVSAAISRVFLTWTEAEDLVVTYAASPQAQRDNLALSSIAHALDRPLDMVEARWKELRVKWERLPEHERLQQVADGRALVTACLNLRPAAPRLPTSYMQQGQ